MSKNIIKIINEEVSNFDFLGNDSYLVEQESIELLKNEDLQKQFICDFLLGKNDKYGIISVSDAIIGGNWEEIDSDDINRLTIDYSPKIEYRYDDSKEPIRFDLFFKSDSISVRVSEKSGGDDYNEERWVNSMFDYINWSDINVTIYTEDGDEIEFTALKKAPIKIQEIFIREFIAPLIVDETQIKISSSEFKDNIRNTTYC